MITIPVKTRAKYYELIESIVHFGYPVTILSITKHDIQISIESLDIAYARRKVAEIATSLKIPDRQIVITNSESRVYVGYNPLF